MRRKAFPVILPGEDGADPVVIGFVWMTEREQAAMERAPVRLDRALKGGNRKHEEFYLAHLTQGIEGLNGKDLWDGASPRFINPGEKIFL
jgi:hypothetical protein